MWEKVRETKLEQDWPHFFKKVAMFTARGRRAGPLIRTLVIVSEERVDIIKIGPHEDRCFYPTDLKLT